MFPVSLVIQESLALAGILNNNSETLVEPADKQARSLEILNALLIRLSRKNLIPISEWIIKPVSDPVIPVVDLNTDLSLIFSSYFIQFLIVALADALLNSFMGQGLTYPITLNNRYRELVSEFSLLAAPYLSYKRIGMPDTLV